MMNNRNRWDQWKDIKAPDELKQKTLAAARQARREAQQDMPQPVAAAPRRRFGMAKRVVAAACAFAVVVGGTAVWKAQMSGQPAADAVAETVAHSFGIVAYAADTGETMEPKDSKIVFDIASGGMESSTEGFFGGCLFKVTGDDIGTISASIDKGGLYRIARMDIQESDADAVLQGTYPPTQGADDLLVHGYDDGDWWVEASWHVENGFVEPYASNTCYGLWGEPKPVDMAQESDLQDAWQGRIDEFDGAVLTVTVTFTDGTQQTRTLTLHTGKLGCEYVDGVNGPQLTGEVLTDEQAETQGYIYGVYAEIA